MNAMTLVEHPAIERQRFRAKVSRLVDRLILILDGIDGDPDLEDGADDEPSLSFTGYSNQDVAIRLEPTGDLRFLDLEMACEDEGAEHDGREPDHEDEPSLCGVTFGSGSYIDRGRYGPAFDVEDQCDDEGHDTDREHSLVGILASTCHDEAAERGTVETGEGPQ